MRTFVTTHPSYQHDSVITPEIAHDLLIACDEIGKGVRACPELLGSVTIDRVRGEDAYGQVLAGRLNPEERSELIQNLIRRAHMRRPEDKPRGTSEGLWGINMDTDSNGNSTTTEGSSSSRGEAEQKGTFLFFVPLFVCFFAHLNIFTYSNLFKHHHYHRNPSYLLSSTIITHHYHHPS